MDVNSVTGRGDEGKIFQQLVGQFGGPAFIRRAREVQAAWEGLLENCRRRRDEWLAAVRLNLGTLHALAGSWANLRPHLEHEETLTALEKMRGELRPQLRLPVAPTTKGRVLKKALRELRESVAFFNQRWLAYVQQVDLQAINALRDGYNRFYLLEKEMVVGSSRIARQHFQKLPPATSEDLLKELPPLPHLQPDPPSFPSRSVAASEPDSESQATARGTL